MGLIAKTCWRVLLFSAILPISLAQVSSFPYIFFLEAPSSFPHLHAFLFFSKQLPEFQAGRTKAVPDIC